MRCMLGKAKEVFCGSVMHEYQTVTRNFYDYYYADKMVIKVSLVIDRKNVVLFPHNFF